MRDYAKNHHPPKKKNPYFFLGSLLFFALAVIISFFIHQHKEIKLQTPPKQKVVLKIQKPKQPTTTTQVAEKSKDTNTIKYDFYQLLAKSTVNVNDNTAVNTDNPTKPSQYYALQVAALKTTQDAEQLKTQLNLSGYTSFIQSSQTNDHEQLYRVMIGPFTALNSAKQQQVSLQDDHIKSLLFKYNRDNS